MAVQDTKTTVQVKEKNTSVLFGRENYKWMVIGLVIMAIGFFLMAGGKSSDPNVFNDKDVYSTTRITIAPILIIAGLIIENLKDRRTTTDKKSYKPEWQKNFLKIREILNDWDPIGVADSVDDEYDTMNFRTLSVLMNKRDKKEIKEILTNYTKNSMELTVDNATLDRVSEQISKIRLE